VRPLGCLFEAIEEPVTLQIAAICDDGWVLASDRREQLFRHSSMTKKIFTDFNAKITYATFGTAEVAKLAAQELLNDLVTGRSVLTGDLPTGQWLEALANRAWQNANALFASQSINSDPLVQGLTIFFHDRPQEFWIMQLGRQSMVKAFFDKRPRGDFTNPATFFLERYYASNLSAEELTLLAAHVICLAAEFNRSGVAGLDITVCKNGRVRELTAPELRQLRIRSAEIDDKIRVALQTT
jgi:hypothetical protein